MTGRELPNSSTLQQFSIDFDKWFRERGCILVRWYADYDLGVNDINPAHLAEEGTIDGKIVVEFRGGKDRVTAALEDLRRESEQNGFGIFEEGGSDPYTLSKGPVTIPAGDSSRTVSMMAFIPTKASE